MLLRTLVACRRFILTKTRTCGPSAKTLPHYTRSLSYYAIKSSLPTPPLSERDASYSVPLSELLCWHRKAVASAKAVDLTQDGLDSSYLLSELTWLMQDAVEGDWSSLRLHAQITKPAPSQRHQVMLRLSLAVLDTLWHQRLNQRVPLQYLTNAAHWKDFVLAVGPGTLIPRPETECIIDFVCEAIADNPELLKGQWADLGTGSGALAIGLASACPKLDQIWAVDSSPDACAWAAFNVERLVPSGRIKVMQGSWFEPLHHLTGQLSGVVSNPPYIAEKELCGLQAEVKIHEPDAALNGGAEDGLCCLAEICRDAPIYLRAGGYLALEMGGPAQTEAVSNMLAADFEDIQQRSDMFGIIRFVTALRKPLQ